MNRNSNSSLNSDKKRAIVLTNVLYLGMECIRPDEVVLLSGCYRIWDGYNIELSQTDKQIGFWFSVEASFQVNDSAYLAISYPCEMTIDEETPQAVLLRVVDDLTATPVGNNLLSEIVPTYRKLVQSDTPVNQDLLISMFGHIPEWDNEE